MLLWLPWRSFEQTWGRAMKAKYPGKVEVVALSRADPMLQKAAAASLRMLPYGFKSDAARMLLSRNYLIMACAQKAVGWPGHGGKGGGTRQALRCAESLDMPVLDLFGQKVTRRLVEEFLDAA